MPEKLEYQDDRIEVLLELHDVPGCVTGGRVSVRSWPLADSRKPGRAESLRLTVSLV